MTKLLKSSNQWQVTIDLVDSTEINFQIDFSFGVNIIYVKLLSSLDPITLALINKSKVNDFKSVFNYLSNLNPVIGFTCSYQYLCIEKECFNIKFKKI